MRTPFGELPDRLAVGMSLAEQYEWLHRPVPRRSVLAGGAVGLTALGLPTFLTTPARATATGIVGRRLALGPDPRTSMYVTFASRVAFSRGRVRASSGQHTIEAAVEVTGTAGVATRYGRCLLTGLKPDTTYRYTLEIDGSTAGSGQLRTAPPEATPFRFTAFGDQATTAASRSMLKVVADLKPRLHLLAGDLSYADSTGLGGPGDALLLDRWDTWLDQNDAVASAVPWMCVPGNHEMEPGFDQHGYAGWLARLPVGGRSPLSVPVATSFTVGNVGFIGLDSNDVSYALPANRGWTRHAQTDWLDRVLAELRSPSSGVAFIVAFMHMGAYCTDVSHPSEGGVRESWVPLFDRYGVDLVISGHNHSYERTRGLRGGAVTDDGIGPVDSTRGTTYITVGGGGASASQGFRADSVLVDAGGSHREPASWLISTTRTTQHVVLCADVDPALSESTTRMRLRAVNAGGAVVDEVILQRPNVRPAASIRSDPVGWAAAGSVLLTGTAAGSALLRSRRDQGRPPDGETVHAAANEPPGASA